MGPFSKAIQEAKRDLKAAKFKFNDRANSHAADPEFKPFQRIAAAAGEELEQAKGKLADAIQAKREAGHGPFSRK